MQSPSVIIWYKYPVFESLDDIVSRIAKKHNLEGPPTDEELDMHLMDVIPPTLQTYVTGFKVSGNILTIFVTEILSREEMKLHAPTICREFNARIGRGAVGEVKARVKSKKEKKTPGE